MHLKKFFETKENSKTYLSCNNLSYELPDRTLFENINVSVNQGDRIALIGDNGTGKSTLLKIFSGKLSPSSGTIHNNKKSSYYLPQVDFSIYNDKQTVGEYLASKRDEWWEVEQKLKIVFGIKEVDYEQPISTLSGGEITKMNLAIGLCFDPDILFLDEPTNHIDILAMENLIETLKNYHGALVVVSHDTFFLDQTTNKVWCLEQGHLTLYGGNYSDYSRQKQIEIEAQERKYEAFKKKLQKLKKSAQLEQKRAERSKNTGKKLAGDRSMSSMEKGTFANIASSSAGKGNSKFNELIEQTREEMSENRIFKKRSINTGLTTEKNIGRKNLFTIRHEKLSIGKKILIDDVNIELKYGDRIAICGANGSGKTVLAKFILGKTENIKTAYISQNYEIIDPEKSLLDNIFSLNSSISYEVARNALGRFLFRAENIVQKQAKFLSGGERARLTFAMISTASIDLLVLDEPTNNLDIATINEIVDSLQEFQGGILVISHNINFLKDIGIHDSYIISHLNMNKMISSPQQSEVFYKELIERIK